MPQTVGLLRRHRKEQAERRLMFGEAWTDLDLVFDRGDGASLYPSELSHSFGRYLKRAGESGVRLLDLRHFLASTCLANGVNAKVISEAMGHSSVAFTMDTYAHLLPSMGEATAKAMEGALGGALGEAIVTNV